MIYKGFEIKAIEYKGTRWFAAYYGGQQLVRYTEVLGQRTGATFPMLFLTETTAKETIRYLLNSNLVEEHI